MISGQGIQILLARLKQGFLAVHDIEKSEFAEAIAFVNSVKTFLDSRHNFRLEGADLGMSKDKGLMRKLIIKAVIAAPTALNEMYLNTLNPKKNSCNG